MWGTQSVNKSRLPNYSRFIYEYFSNFFFLRRKGGNLSILRMNENALRNLFSHGNHLKNWKIIFYFYKKKTNPTWSYLISIYLVLKHWNCLLFARHLKWWMILFSRQGVSFTPVIYLKVDKNRHLEEIK